MAKKKDIVYVSPNSNVPINQVEQKVQEIPHYEDSGVKYQSKYKIQQTETRYELRGQRTRWTLLALDNTAFGSTLFDRPNYATSRFYCTKLIFTFHAASVHSISLGQMHVADVNAAGNASIRWVQFPVETDGVYIYDFSDSPREFTGRYFDFYTQFSLDPTEFYTVLLFGWEEQL